MTRAPSEAEIELARSILPGPAWTRGRVLENGDDHLVLVPGDDAPEAVLRLARRPEVGALLQGRMRLLDALAPHLPFRLPLPLSAVHPADDAGRAAVAQRWVPGAPHPPHEGDPSVLALIVEALAAVPREAWAGLVEAPAPGYGVWSAERREAVLGALPHDETAGARAVMDALDALHPPNEQRDQISLGLVHGDLAGYNMHWDGPTLGGVLDWDHASEGDSALNLAHLALWHGAGVIDAAAPDPGFARRASLWLGHEALRRVEDAAAQHRELNWAKLLRKTVPRIHFAARRA